jgi:hypothetical protein
MKEFGEMLKEAFVGEEPFDPSPGRALLEASIDKFDRRMRTVRYMSWFGVVFMGAVMFYAVYSFFDAPPEAETKKLILWASLFLWSNIGVGMLKFFLMMMINDIGLRKELKRTQLMILEGRESG